MKNFILIGAAGYIANRHFKAIKDTGNNLIAAMDVNDSVGIMDSYFPNAEFFTEFEQFTTFVNDQIINGTKIDFVSICSPNYLHFPQMKWALSQGIDVICEKPLVLHAAELEMLKTYEQRYKAKIFSILQLRLHSSIKQLKHKIDPIADKQCSDVRLTYITSRGKWYSKSWKGDEKKSGGISANIGVHFFDMLCHIFGDPIENEVHLNSEKKAAGLLKFSNANIEWFLSIDSKDLPQNYVAGEKLTYRSITIDEEELEFSSGFTELHTESYKEILEGKGYNLDDNFNAISIVENIRSSTIDDKPKRCHPMLKNL